MLSFSNVCLRRGTRALFEESSFTIHAGQKVGVTGANGTGKSSLFAMILGQIQVDRGDFSMPPSLAIAHVAQETPAVSRTALDYTVDGDAELRRLQQALAEAEQADDGEQIAALHGDIENVDGYTAEARAAKLLAGLGFSVAQQQTPVKAFSGGWRMRLNLAQALMCRSDLLLLDEPTNHLDLDAVIWLEGWLRQYPGTLLLISHDRDFLDNVMDHIAHIEHQRIRLYSGNYSAFEARRAEQLAGQQAAYEKQQREIAHMQRFVDRFKAKATKAKQAQSRVKALSRMQLIAPAHVDSPFNFSFFPPDKLPSMLMQVEDASVGYGHEPLLSGVRLTLMPGERIALLGANGAGKSTLIKLIAGELPLMAGKVTQAKDLRVGYFAQHTLEQLRPEQTPVSHLQQLDKSATERDLRDFLGGFGFSGDRALSPVAPFSGGEKARLVLAMLVYQRPNVLLLDEPTNHLDLEMRHALSVALQDFDGAVVLISHDRHLLQIVADTLVLVSAGRAELFDGDLDDYARWLSHRTDSADDLSANAVETSANSAEARKQRKRDEAAMRQKLQPWRKQQQQAEKQMATLQTQCDEMEQQLADPAMYGDDKKGDLKALLLKQAELKKQLDSAEADWLAAVEAIEEMSTGVAE